MKKSLSIACVLLLMFAIVGCATNQEVNDGSTSGQVRQDESSKMCKGEPRCEMYVGE